MRLKSLLSVSAFAAAAVAPAQMRITEWMYNGSEFAEFTNVGKSAVDLAGWSFDDNTRTAGSFSLSGFGTVAGGESVILSEASATDFRTLWGLASSVKVIGGNTNNLGRADEINLYDVSSALVDRLTYNDQAVAGDPAKGPRTDVASANVPLTSLGTNVAANAALSKVSDAYGSLTATTGGFVANPGRYAPVPEPASMAVLGLGVLGLLRRRKG